MILSRGQEAPMLIRLGLPILVVATVTACTSLTADVRGRVVDEEGRPFGGAQVFLSTYPTPTDILKPVLQTNADGEFHGEVTFLSHGGSPVLVVDAERSVGGLARFNRRREPVTIVVQPLSRVRGRVSYEKIPKPLRVFAEEGMRGRWVSIGRPYAIAPDELRSHPLERVASTQLEDGRFEFLLPPGEYQAEVHGLHEAIVQRFKVDREQKTVDVGTWEAKPLPEHEIYGAPAPELRFADARGIAKEGGLAALKGKWVLLYLWDHRMVANNWLPALIRFYTEHPEYRDRLEIVGVHNCDDVLSVMELEGRRAWATRMSEWQAIPFPVGIDDDEKTPNAYGMVRGRRRGSPHVALIDPEGIVTFNPNAYNIVTLLKSKLGVD
jgi:hypothetical protein